MSHLPASIEAYLEEAGFSATEMLIVRQLLDHGATTLREIAVKTGKSTGVLDQAMRKLLSNQRSKEPGAGLKTSNVQPYLLLGVSVAT